MLLYTKAQLKVQHEQALQELVDYAGGRAHLAKMLSITLPTVNSWIDRGRISVHGAKTVSKNSALSEKFPMSILRPEQ